MDAVWLYGSYARGDFDRLSDIDLLYVSDREELSMFPDTIQSSDDVSVSRYSWREMERMAEYGSLFLHHLRLEGRPIAESTRCEGRLEKLLGSLVPYELAARDIVGFTRVIDDVVESLEDGQGSLTYELSTLGTVFRHAAILGCAVKGSFCFSRREPVEKMVSLSGLPMHWALEFPSLYAYRLFVDGRISECDAPSIELAEAWSSRTRAVVNVIGRWICE